MTRFSWLRMTRRSTVWQNESRNRRTHYLERRIVFCADCESPRALTFDSGSLACSSCGSGNWMHPPSNGTMRFPQYPDAEPGVTISVQHPVGRPSKAEDFFAPEVALV
jgi:hypothetical protein